MNKLNKSIEIEHKNCDYNCLNCKYSTCIEAINGLYIDYDTMPSSPNSGRLLADSEENRFDN